jgi:ubiquitin C-terminal hydrolase
MTNIIGLTNGNNYCYMNSVLQCIFQSDIFVKYFINDKYVNDLVNSINYDNETNLEKTITNTLSFAFNNLLININKNNDIINPDKFRKIFQMKNKKFNIKMQNDSCEFLTLFFETIHNELKTKTEANVDLKKLPKKTEIYLTKMNEYKKKIIQYKSDEIKLDNIVDEFNEFKRNNLEDHIILKYISYIKKLFKNNYSIIYNTFTNYFLTTIKCLECNNTSITFENTEILILSLPSSIRYTNLNDCMDEYFKTIKLGNDNLYQCEICNKKTNAKKNSYVWKTSKILIIQFGRFCYNNYTSRNNINVEFDIELDLTKYGSKHKTIHGHYTLYAIIVQLGNLNFGHYYAYVKKNNIWYVVNDENTYIFGNDDDVLNKINKCDPYVLFYKRIKE